MKHRRLLPLFLVVAIAGCQGDKSSATPTDAGSTGTTATTETTGASTGTTGAASTATTGATAEAPKPTDAEVPAELKHDAYHYYGLSNSMPMDLEVKYSSRPDSLTGSQTVSLKSMQDGKPTYIVDRTGRLAELGTQDMVLDKDGLFVTSSSFAKVTGRQIEMPAKLTPGTKWDSTVEVDRPGQQMKIASTYKVVGPQKVKTKAGEREALLITSVGTGTLNGAAVRMESKSWYVRGVGGVKSEVSMSTGGKKEFMTIQETN